MVPRRGPRRGLTTFEYALLLALLVVVAIGVWIELGYAVNQHLEGMSNTFPSSTNVTVDGNAVGNAEDPGGSIEHNVKK
jgi:Flp pilus assembly pilin Flp